MPSLALIQSPPHNGRFGLLEILMIPLPIRSVRPGVHSFFNSSKLIVCGVAAFFLTCFGVLAWRAPASSAWSARHAFAHRFLPWLLVVVLLFVAFVGEGWNGEVLESTLVLVASFSPFPSSVPLSPLIFSSSLYISFVGKSSVCCLGLIGGYKVGRKSWTLMVKEGLATLPTHWHNGCKRIGTCLPRNLSTLPWDQIPLFVSHCRSQASIQCPSSHQELTCECWLQLGFEQLT